MFIKDVKLIPKIFIVVSGKVAEKSVPKIYQFNIAGIGGKCPP